MNELRLRLDEHGQLWAQDGHDRDVVVEARYCFPWSAPGCFVSLRDTSGSEVAMLDSIDELDESSMNALQSTLAQTAFVMQIDRVDAIEAEFEIRKWQAHTRQGPVKFQTRLDEWPRQMPGGGLLLRDLSGNLFHIENVASLDAHSRKLLWAFVD